MYLHMQLKGKANLWHIMAMANKVNILRKILLQLYNKYLFAKHAKKIKNCALSCRIIAKITIGDIHEAPVVAQ